MPERRQASKSPAAPVTEGGSAEFLVAPDPEDDRLARAVSGIDHAGDRVDLRVVEERPLTLYLNDREIVTVMTIGDYPEYLGIGYLLNQGLIRLEDGIEGADFDEELAVVVVRTKRSSDYEAKLQRATRTSGCAVGTVFGDMMEIVEGIRLPEAPLRTSWLYALARKINTRPSLYLAAGAIHGCVLCAEDRPLIYMEDVGRHNAVDKIAGMMAMEGISAADKVFYTTGRLTSEMVLKTAMMGIPILASRSGFTAWGVEIARQLDMTLIGRLRGKRFVCLSGAQRLVYDAVLGSVAEEPPAAVRKGSREVV